MFEVLRKIGLLDIQQSKFYAACIILILEHLHERNILYRDLKPENIMVDEDGYLRLIDFGVSKVVTDRTFTTTGTPHYMAPEIIQNKGYNTSVDYWGLGILLYEFIAGDVPFAANKNDPIEVYKAILNGELNYPTIVNANHKAKSLIEQLLNKNPALRGNAATLKKHNLFENFDWEALLDKRVSPPYRQKLPRFD